jgi:hypothetical protein
MDIGFGTDINVLKEGPCPIKEAKTEVLPGVANAIGHSDDRAGVSAKDDPLGRSGEGSRKLGLTPEGMMGCWRTIWVLDSAGRGQSS